ncbi:helix-turn-helix domain-containing protein [Streptomyces sp. JJ38]|uniref:helix-turn-helix domain-containing protein n=1 Tax=Streptomyces sp. JJ38 TaxID=2738128 RepID=UPI001C57D26A|nr:helix-turn-helix domain-containing protein [Streptomyces sp. JJ38]MBW1596852.1 helix-turn-helix transcriptional regulator [Streptomyces sp. JJ38]
MLEALDLDAVQQQVYEALVDGAVTTAELRDGLGLSVTRVRGALGSLEELGLIQRVAGRRRGPDRFLPVEPDVALAALLAAREEELQRARRHVHHLAARFRAAADARDPLDVVEVVVGRAAVMQRVDQLQRGARHLVRGVDRPPYVNSDPDRHDARTGMMPLQGETMRRGVAYRVLYDAEGLATFHSTHTDILACAELGEEARVLTSAPTKMLLADEQTGILPLRTTHYEVASCVVVHASGLLDALSSFFEVLWAQALPLSDFLADDEGDGDGPGLPCDDTRLLALLATGLTDQVMARQLGVSHRTFQRRLRATMERLGVTTRFQLGMVAARLDIGGGVVQPEADRVAP